MAIGDKRKKMSRKRSNNKEKYDEKRGILNIRGDVSASIPPLVACTSNNNMTSSRTICLQCDHDYRDVMEWFVLRIPFPDLTKKVKGLESGFREVAAFNHSLLHQQEEKKVVLNPVFSCEKRDDGKGPVPLWGNAFACLGSTIYTIGGSTKENDISGAGSKLVHYFDTKDNMSSSSRSWKRGPSMIVTRWNPQVVALDGKLYVFGSQDRQNIRVWAEVLDPKDGQWQPLPSPPPSCVLESSLQYSVISPPTDLEEDQDITSTSCKNKKKKIVIATLDRAYEFDIASGCWAVVKNSDFHWRLTDNHYQPVAVDDVLYWFEDEFHAYDIAKGFSFTGPVQDFIFQDRQTRRTDPDDLRDRPYRPAIVHLGGRYFCMLLCLNDLDSETKSHNLNLHCLTVKVSRTKERYQEGDKNNDFYGSSETMFFLSVSVVSCQSYPLSHHPSHLSGRIMPI